MWLCVCDASVHSQTKAFDFLRRFYFISLVGQQTGLMISFGSLWWRIWLQPPSECGKNLLIFLPSTLQRQHPPHMTDRWHVNSKGFCRCHLVGCSNVNMMSWKGIFFFSQCASPLNVLGEEWTSLGIEEAVCQPEEVVLEIEFGLLAPPSTQIPLSDSENYCGLKYRQRRPTWLCVSVGISMASLMFACFGNALWPFGNSKTIVCIHRVTRHSGVPRVLFTNFLFALSTRNTMGCSSLFNEQLLQNEFSWMPFGQSGWYPLRIHSNSGQNVFPCRIPVNLWRE